MDGHSQLDNPNPEVKVLHRTPQRSDKKQTIQEKIFDAIRDIRDPEHPHSLEELSVVDLQSIVVDEPLPHEIEYDQPGYSHIRISFTPTVPHCSLASIIGLSIHSKLRQSSLLRPPGERYYKLTVFCAEGSHVSADDINRQLADKERVAAAFENPKIMTLLNQCTENLPGHLF